MRPPFLRHITTCLNCGWREAIRPGNAYAERCPNDGLPLEHDVRALDDRQELKLINQDTRPFRFRTHHFTTR